MRVLMVVRPATGGMKRQVLALSAGVRAAGHTVEIAAPADGGVLSDAEQADFRTHVVTIVGPLSPPRDARAIAALVGILRRGRFDVLHAHGFKAGFVARLATLFVRVPAVIVTVHNHVLYRDDISTLTKWRYRVVERLLAARSTSYVTVSDSLRDELIAAYHVPAAKVVTVHNGVPMEELLAEHDGAAVREVLQIAPGAPVLGTACRFAPQKGLRYLIDALPEVRAHIPDAMLVLGGDGPLAEELKARAEADGVADAIVWPGMVDDVPAFLSAIDAYVSSSLSEGLPLALVEAAAAGVPTVATNAGGTPEIVESGATGLLVEAGDAHALAEACVRVLEDRSAAASFGQAARRRALEEFTPQMMVSRTLEVYRQAVTGLA